MVGLIVAGMPVHMGRRLTQVSYKTFVKIRNVVGIVTTGKLWYFIDCRFQPLISAFVSWRKDASIASHTCDGSGRVNNNRSLLSLYSQNFIPDHVRDTARVFLKVHFKSNGIQFLKV